MDMNKEILLEAINYYDDYTVTQRKILKFLVNMAIDDIVVITPAKLIKLLNANKSTVYLALGRFQEDKLIMLADPSKNGKFTKFKLNQEQLNIIIKRFELQRNCRTD